MKSQAVRVEDFLSQNKRNFFIPVYQRNYDWGQSQCQQLFDDIIEIGNQQQRQEHFIGSIVFIEEGVHQTGITELSIIDGQQRLTTLTLIYLALQHLYAKANRQEDAEEIWDTFLVNKYASEDRKLKLRPTENNDDALQYLIQGKAANDYSEFSQIIENFTFFQRHLNEVNCEQVRRGLSRLMFVEISLDKHQDDPQRIFESLNSTGLDLSQADLIRNYILMDLNPREQKEIYETYWLDIEKLAYDQTSKENRVSDFIRDYLTNRNKNIPNKNKVYQEFKKKYVWSNTDKDEIRINKIEASLQDILSAARYYNRLINPENENDRDIRQQLKYIQRLEINVAFPFLLQVYADYAEECIDKRTFVQILRLTLSFTWRRFIVNIPTNSLNKIFMTLYDKINPDDYVNSIEQYLCHLTRAQRFPTDSEVKEALRTRDLYNIRPKNRIHLLECLENTNNNETVLIEGNSHITIEHIFPQHPCPKWKSLLDDDQYSQIIDESLNILGNLTLSGNNGDLGNKTFTEKRDMKDVGYRDSRLWLNRDLAKCEKWDLDEINKRTVRLTERFLEIWPYPQVESVPRNATEEVNIFDAESPTGKQLEYFIYRDKMLKVTRITDLYREVVADLFKENPHAFLDTNLGHKLGFDKTSETTKFRQPMTIDKLYSIECNIDSASKFERIKQALEVFGMEDELFIKYANGPLASNVLSSSAQKRK